MQVNLQYGDVKGYEGEENLLIDEMKKNMDPSLANTLAFKKSFNGDNSSFLGGNINASKIGSTESIISQNGYYPVNVQKFDGSINSDNHSSVGSEIEEVKYVEENQ